MKKLHKCLENVVIEPYQYYAKKGELIATSKDLFCHYDVDGTVIYKDDLFDLLGTEYETGKDSGGDVKKNMMTLPLIYSYDIMSKLERRRLKTLLGSKKKTSKIMQ